MVKDRQVGGRGTEKDLRGFRMPRDPDNEKTPGGIRQKDEDLAPKVRVGTLTEGLQSFPRLSRIHATVTAQYHESVTQTVCVQAVWISNRMAKTSARWAV